ncbi:MAG: TonB family protein [Dissulfurispiraceae bacterium]|jgi:protein TonB|nr:TonB family protein [Dissulfurispiraceae bacterium]
MTFDTKYPIFVSIALHASIILLAFSIVEPVKQAALNAISVELVSVEKIETETLKSVKMQIKKPVKNEFPSTTVKPVKTFQQNEHDNSDKELIPDYASLPMDRTTGHESIADDKLPVQSSQIKTEQKEAAQKSDAAAGKVKTETALPYPLSTAREITALAVNKTAQSSAPAEFEFGAAGAPAFLYREIPVYPFTARRMGKEGVVRLRLMIDDKGELQKIEVVDAARYGFTESAMEAVRKSRFRPAVVNGNKVLSKVLLTVRFRLSE